MAPDIQPMVMQSAPTPRMLWRLVWMILVDHLQSQRILVEWASAVGMALLVLRDSTNVTSILSTWTLYAILISLYTMSVIADSAEQPFQIQRLLAIQSRRTYLYAQIIATNIIVYSCQIILVVMSVVAAPLARPSWLVLAQIIPSTGLIIAVATTAMMLLTPLVSTAIQRIVVLCVIAIPIAWESISSRVFLALTPSDTLLTLQDAFNTLFGVLLWPSLHLFAITVQPEFSQFTALTYLIHIGVVIVGIWLAQRLFAHKNFAQS